MLAQWSDGSYAAFTGGTVNPLPMIEQGLGGNNIRQTGNLKVAAVLEYKPVEAFGRIEGGAAADGRQDPSLRGPRRVPSDPYGTIAKPSNAEYNSLDEMVTGALNGYYHAMVSAAHNFGNHNLRLMLGTSFEDYDYYSLGPTGRISPIPTMRSSAPAATTKFQEQLGKPHPDGPWHRSSGV